MATAGKHHRKAIYLGLAKPAGLEIGTCTSPESPSPTAIRAWLPAGASCTSMLGAAPGFGIRGSNEATQVKSALTFTHLEVFSAEEKQPVPSQSLRAFSHIPQLLRSEEGKGTFHTQGAQERGCRLPFHSRLGQCWSYSFRMDFSGNPAALRPTRPAKSQVSNQHHGAVFPNLPGCMGSGISSWAAEASVLSLVSCT